MKIATAPSRLSKKWRTSDVTWDWMLKRLRAVKRTGETCAEYRRMTRDEQALKKDVGGFVGGAISGGRRIASAVTERWFVTLDADENAHIEDGAEFAALYGCAMAVYSTHSSTPENLRLRWIIPLSRAVTVEEYQAIARKIAEHIDIESMDTSTYQAERLMYWPSCPDDAEPVFREYTGNILSPDEILAEYGPGKAWQDVSLWPLSSREGEVVIREAKKQGDPETKPGIVGKWCRTYDVEEVIAEFLSDVYEPCDMPSGKPRYTYSAGSSSGGAVVEDGGKFLYSHHATDPAGGQLCNSFDLVRIHKFGAMDEGKEPQEITRRPSYKAMCEFAAADPGFRQHEYQERLEQIEADFADLGEIVEGERRPTDTDCVEPKNTQGLAPGAAEAPAAEDESKEDTKWVEKLTVNHKTGEVDPTIANAELILRNDPKLRGAIAYDRFSNKQVARKRLPWRKAEPDAGGAE